MPSKLSYRIERTRAKKKTISGLFNQSKYAVLTLMALWMSARFGGMCNQFLALAVILGLKWVFPGQKQVIQIFTQERGADESK